MPTEGVRRNNRSNILSFEEILTFVSMLQQKVDIGKVKITGGEPLVRKNLMDLIQGLNLLGIPEVSLTSNGQLLAEQAEELVEAGLRRVNISLDTVNPQTYTALTGYPHLEKTLRGVERVRELGLSPTKINCVVMRNYNYPEIAELADYCMQHDLQLRILELMPIGPAVSFYNQEFVSTEEVKRDLLSKGYQLNVVEKKSREVANYVMLTSPQGAQAQLGFISSQTGSFCRGCTRLRLTARGEFVPCLMQNYSTNVRPYLHTDPVKGLERLTQILQWAVACKSFTRHNEEHKYMVNIGG
jgi:cyclic pyranopterin phosphate synthase